jgi:hypothetical protein
MSAGADREVRSGVGVLMSAVQSVRGLEEGRRAGVGGCACECLQCGPTGGFLVFECDREQRTYY